jgi:type I restriction enzyme R subunit
MTPGDYSENALVEQPAIALFGELGWATANRQELDDQIYKEFAATGAVTEKQAQAPSGKHLDQLLRENHRYVFTLIQKFHTDRGRKYPKLSDRSDIIVVTDEAHRSQYDLFALNMRNALPRAAFIGFTGTPLMIGEEKTREVFGDYVSVYNFRQSVEDQATVPLYYENRVPELQLTNPDLNTDMEQVLEEAELDEEQERRLEREFARDYHLITRDDRLETIAKDIVTHFLGRGQKGKAMVVSIDKATAVRIYDKVQKHWRAYLKDLKKRLAAAPEDERPALQDQIKYLEETDMALDKPMRNHTLMQTIARANRVFRDKVNGLIVDYINVFRDLQKALAIYGSAAGGGMADGDSPVQNKNELVEALRTAIAEAIAFCTERGVDPAVIQAAQGFQRIKRLDDAVEALIINDESKRKYLLLAAGVARLYKAILPDPMAGEFAPACVLLAVLAEKIRSLTPPADISAVLEQVGQLLDRSVASEGYVIRESSSPYATGGTIDLSQIDFDMLKARFVEGRKRTEAERLRGAIHSKLQKLVRLNRTRMDFLAKFQEMIDAYNAGSLNVEELFRQLVAFAQDLNQEEKCHIGEQLTEEELALFDLLTKPAIKLTKKEQRQVKKVARELLEALKMEKLVLDWRKKQQARAAVQVCIRDYLEQLPAAFTPELREEKATLAYQHVYDSYLGEGRGIYPAA